MKLKDRHYVSRRYLARLPGKVAELRTGPQGSKDPIRAAAPATVRLRCTNEACMKRFRAADVMRCPHCCHKAIVIGSI